MNNENLEALKNKLIKLASTTVGYDNEDFNAYDYSGGNYDDAFYMGMTAGEVYQAREICEAMGWEFE